MRIAIIVGIWLLQSVSSLAQAQQNQSIPGFILRSDASIEAAADRLENELGDKAMVFEVIGIVK